MEELIALGQGHWFTEPMSLIDKQVDQWMAGPTDSHFLVVYTRRFTLPCRSASWLIGWLVGHAFLIGILRAVFASVPLPTHT